MTSIPPVPPLPILAWRGLVTTSTHKEPLVLIRPSIAWLTVIRSLDRRPIPLRISGTYHYDGLYRLPMERVTLSPVVTDVDPSWTDETRPTHGVILPRQWIGPPASAGSMELYRPTTPAPNTHPFAQNEDPGTSRDTTLEIVAMPVANDVQDPSLVSVGDDDSTAFTNETSEDGSSGSSILNLLGTEDTPSPTPSPTESDRSLTLVQMILVWVILILMVGGAFLPYLFSHTAPPAQGAPI